MENRVGRGGAPSSGSAAANRKRRYNGGSIEASQPYSQSKRPNNDVRSSAAPPPSSSGANRNERANIARNYRLQGAAGAAPASAPARAQNREARHNLSAHVVPLLIGRVTSITMKKEGESGYF